MPAFLIINADDLGRSLAVNEAAFRLMEQGKLTSGTVLPTGEAFEDCAWRARRHPRCSFGVHLFLDEFRPLTDLGRFPAVLQPDGRFKADARLYHYDAALRNALTQEWIAQVRRVQQAGISISHLDSHNHIHTYPWLFGVLKSVQRATGIRKVRCSLNCYPRPSKLMGLKKWLYNTALRYRPATLTTDYFMPFGIFVSLLNSDRLPEAASYELMVHPGAGTYMEHPEPYEAELKQLEGNWEKSLPWAFRLINYHELGSWKAAPRS